MVKGPSPWASRAPQFTNRSSPSLSSFLKARNYILPSLNCCSVNGSGGGSLTPRVEVFHTFLRPAMYLTELSARMLPYPYFSLI